MGYFFWEIYLKVAQYFSARFPPAFNRCYFSIFYGFLTEPQNFFQWLFFPSFERFWSIHIFPALVATIHKGLLP